MTRSGTSHTATDAVDNPHDTEETRKQFLREGEFDTCNASPTVAGRSDAPHVEGSTSAYPIEGEVSVADVDASPTPREQGPYAIPSGADRERSSHAESDIAVSGMEITLATGGILLWFMLFAGGILISSQPYRDQLGAASNAIDWMSAYVMTILFWTITNVGLLTCLAALLGAIGYRTRFANQITHDRLLQPISRRTPLPFDAAYYLSAVMRGFGIYALSFTGLLVLATDAFQNPDQGAYLRLASTMSMVGFYAGYDPGTFAGLLQRVKQFFEAK